MEYIVINEENKPMGFDGDQFVFVRGRTKSTKFPLVSYPEMMAKKLIREDRHFRSVNKLTRDKLYLMPFSNSIL